MSKIWPDVSADPKKNVTTRYQKELLKQEEEYKEYLQSQKRLNPVSDKVVRVKEDEEGKRREFLYDSSAIQNALKDRNREGYSAKDMDNEFAITKAPSKNNNDKELWMNKEVEASDDFDIDSSIPKPRELRTLAHAHTQNPVKLQQELNELHRNHKSS
jgi:hypothetical protein